MKLQSLSHIAQMIACIGIVPAIWGIFDSAQKAQVEEQKTQALLRLTAFPALDGIIQRDRELREKILEATADLNNMARHNQLREVYDSGRSAYLGTVGLADVGRHYEYLGVMIRLGYVEFRPIFEIVSFPDDLWNAAEESGIITMIREENWSGAGKPMPDFWSNFEYLRTCYHQARKGLPIPGEEPPPKPNAFDRLLDSLSSKQKKARETEP